ncbi:MAG: DUF2339 domain-containing protein, partial [Deltaproteobacteria bacterium]|nr:DUF2339 domain-containing protein [Kofleriaceae bacterium]
FLAMAVACVPPVGLVFANPRFVLLAATAAALLGVRAAGRRLPATDDPSIDDARRWIIDALPALVLGGMLVVVSSEAWQHARLGVEDPLRAGWLGQMALSCAWSGFAAAALALGFRLRAPTLRVFALLLFGVTVAKLLLVDLARVQQIYRVASFLVLGVTLFAASWLYHRPGARR